MGTVIVDIYYTGNNFCAQGPVLAGCVRTASTLSDMKRNIKDAIEFHVESSLENNEPIPEVFKGKINLNLKLNNVLKYHCPGEWQSVLKESLISPGQ